VYGALACARARARGASDEWGVVGARVRARVGVVMCLCVPACACACVGVLCVCVWAWLVGVCASACACGCVCGVRVCAFTDLFASGCPLSCVPLCACALSWSLACGLLVMRGAVGLVAFVFVGGDAGPGNLAVARPFSACVWSLSIRAFHSCVVGVSVMWFIQLVPWGACSADEIAQDSVMYPHDQ